MMWFEEHFFNNNKSYDFEKSGRIAEAIASYEEKIVKEVDIFFNYYRLLVLYRKNKDYANEKRIAELALSNQPFDRSVEDFLNERLFKIGYLDGSIEKVNFKKRNESNKAELQKQNEKYNQVARVEEIKRYRKQDFIVGYEINPSNNPKHVNDVCKMFQGKYPKTFLWDGCQDGCKCQLTSIMLTPKEIDMLECANLKGKRIKIESVNQVKSLPASFYSYIEANLELLSSYRKAPLYIKSNFIDGDVAKGVNYGKLGIDRPQSRNHSRIENNSKQGFFKRLFGIK